MLSACALRRAIGYNSSVALATQSLHLFLGLFIEPLKDGVRQARRVGAQKFFETRPRSLLASNTFFAEMFNKARACLMITMTYGAAGDVRYMVLPAASHMVFASHMCGAGTLRFEYFSAVLAWETKDGHIDVMGFGGGGAITTSRLIMSGGGGDKRANLTIFIGSIIKLYDAFPLARKIAR